MVKRDNYKKVLEAVARAYKEEADDWETGTAPDDDDDMVEPPVGPSWTPAVFLGRLSASEMDLVSVSKVSIFGHNYWDFQEEGSPAYRGTARLNLARNFSDTLMSTDAAGEELLSLVKCLTFYNLPPNALFVRVRSFNTVPSAASSIFTIARLLCSRGILVDHNGNGAVLHADYLTQSDVQEWADTTENLSVKYQVLYQIVNWQKLSRGGYLPSHLSLSRELVSDEMLQEVQKKWQEYRDSCIGYLPVPLDDLGIVVPFCVEMVEKYAENILAVHEDITGMGEEQIVKSEIPEGERIYLAIKGRPCPDLWPLQDFRTAAGSVCGAAKTELRRAVRKSPQQEGIADEIRNIQKLSNGELVALAEKAGVDLESFREGSVLYDLAAIRFHYQSLVVRLRTACELLILLVTGMRRVELAHLTAGAARKVSKDELRLKFLVFKTSEASGGDMVDLPVPEIAYRAFLTLERISAAARAKAKTDRLFINIFNGKNGPRHVKGVYTYMVKLSEFLGLSTPIHPHQLRKSLAMFFIYHDPRNLTLLKRLFSHKSLTMTFKYIVQMPGMSEEIRRSVIETHMDILLDLMEAVDEGQIGGSAGRRFRESVEKSNFLARLNDDGYESVRMFIETLLEHETKILRRCPMGVICTKVQMSIVDSGPEACDCDIVSCDNAIFIEDSIPYLQDEIRFYTKVILHNKKTGPAQRRYAEERVRGCLERLSELVGPETVASDYPDLYASAA
jgi:integrase